MSEEKTRTIVICGPTAVGKSSIAVEVARELSAEIISADSMQVYRGIPVITDQPGPALLATVPHHLVGFVPLDEEYSAASFSADARAAIADIEARGFLPLLAGGTGLYVRALLGDFTFGGADSDARERWETLLEEEGSEAAVDALRDLDPEAAVSIDTSNPRRVVRALEAASAGEPVSGERDRLWSRTSPFDAVSFILELPREELYDRIDRRVDEMLAAGAVEEVGRALETGLSRTAAQAIGIGEIAAFIAGEATLEEAAAAIKQKSRNYAKRQLTWMRKMPDVVRIDLSGRAPAEAAREIINHIRSANGAPPA